MKLFGRKEIKHSEAYTDFKAQLKAVGRQRMEGYDPNLVRENSKWVVYYLERGAYDGVVFLTAKERRAVTSLNPLQSSSRDGNSRIYGCEKGER